MTCYKLTIEYDGTFFHGFQKQKNTSKTVQETLETAICSLTNERASVNASGRTDAGVHAIGQVIHFHLEKMFKEDLLQKGLNYYLINSGCFIVDTEIVPEHFHARFDCKKRTYEYLILNRKAPPALLKNRVWHIFHDLDVTIMQKSAKVLEGHHNFNAFRASSCQAKNPWRTIDSFSIDQLPENIIKAEITSTAFLHHQVRMMMGTLVHLGMGKISFDHLLTLRDSGKKSDFLLTAPAYGLYFKKAIY